MYQLKDFGSFYVSGRKIVLENQPPKITWRSRGVPPMEIEVNGDYLIDQGYVQYFIPEHENHLPIILIHGGGHTGAVWETTPDGRPGWLHYFLNQNRTVYVLDNVERGRASWCSLPGIWQDEPDIRSGLRIWDDFRIGKIENYLNKIPYPTQQFPVDYFDGLLLRNVPKWNTHVEASAATIAELANKIGDCWLISHSQSGEFAYRAVSQASKSIHGAVFIEPTSFGTPITPSHSRKPFLYLYGDFFEDHEFWLKLQSMAKEQHKELISTGAAPDWIELPQIGVQGNSHLPMMDLNSDVVAKKIHEWLILHEFEYKNQKESL